MAARARGRLPELDSLRGIAILGVLMVHATSVAVGALPNSTAKTVYIVLNTLSLFCVPAFIFLSGFVLFYQYVDKPLTPRTLGDFYLKRLKQLAIPYVFISLGYELCTIAMSHKTWEPMTLLQQFGKHLLYGKSYTHLYYVIITLQLYVLFPLLLLLFRKLRVAAWAAVPIGFVIQWTFYLMNRDYWHLAAKASWSFTYIFIFMLGAYLGMKSTTYQRWFHNKREDVPDKRQGTTALAKVAAAVVGLLWLASTAGFLWLYIAYRTGKPVPEGYWFEIGYQLYTSLTTIVLLKGCAVLNRSAVSRAIAKRLQQLGALSFGIYLIHPLFLLLYRRYVPNSGWPPAYHLWIVGGYIAALGLSIGVLLFMFRYVRWSWVLLGPTPAGYGPSSPRISSLAEKKGQ
ncbi:surface polysaccharide O-acyltransferase-like enzyme [Paenibacillus cellulosilyticus]|uniref:Surface polysaccharide O-acyltransferase-like enzyme n=1 Tax=Paenibacillus cellulosilyticus TaxID=375489 RepID=A0A2V2YVL2_9BACL|nr:acyltransferase [Paenibacillus cellulosilyticus]PWW05267.1 surface polysaccharide O-acyltransferase-like enzyme [Paenibacillus cellulosilyticus]QKS43591.1 acyltransferase [Paenibacillus cellulosilyticus]